MKAHTDLEQSKKLAEFLPIESADMLYYCNKNNNTLISQRPFIRSFKETDTFSYLYCWSLSALLGILSKQMYFLDEDGRISLSSYKGNMWNITSINAIDKEPLEADDPLDAAFEMVVWLKENKKI